MATSVASPVITSTRKGTVYLEIVPHGTKVRVQRTEAGRTLNRFWTVWLRQLLLEKTDTKHGFAVELRDTSVLVSSRTTQQGLVETVRALCQEIVPMPNPPIVRLDRNTTSREAYWEVDEILDLTDCIKELRLPDGARVSGRGSRITLRRGQKNPFRMSELCLMVELHVALCCRS